MKKIIGFWILLLFTACDKAEVQKKLDLNGTFEGTLTGWAQPINLNGTAKWIITHTGDKIDAKIINSAQYVADTFTYSGTVINDTTFIGKFMASGTQSSSVNGTISKDGNHIVAKTALNDQWYEYVRVTYDLTRKK